jgi:hypothetical protein
MKQELKHKSMFTKEVRAISTRKIAERLMMIMTDHVGYTNAVTKQSLFRKIFVRDYNDNNSACWMLWEFTKKAMHLLRSQSNCFIANTRNKADEYVFFVVSNDYDANLYVNQLENCIKNMRIMQKRVQRSVKEEWSRQTWLLGYTPVKRISR